ncbi:carbohydrate kinase [Streptomyces sp. PRh5]|uniref:bifunctional ADP-dependent NAD(P)H-hydrate dehydratase/NAD(P)H-hydrate epimerase n=1 Tax=Streptomyces sp. PRh5 TaxID=1158056 RepID=UPI0004479387|nr:bifunctional ADP-dependent NAD(P)H-hydrate dehydratase/NAD(P)H-hydrate epimerase [Streptomyces sp. PRh5]EXU67154.1 carbohydrate kinase [Streptomyces sp. PRh5]
MRNAYSVETVRTAERELMARLPGGALMQRAAAGLAAACADLLGRVYGSRVALLVGSGDNGGDALYAGARLARRGAGVTAVLLNPDRAHGGGLAALRAAGGRVVTADGGANAANANGGAEAAVARADLVVDGIVGIGGKGGLRPDAERLVRAVRGILVAVDLPSGVDADTGEVRGSAVRADATITFGTYKPGLLIDPAHTHAGALRLVDIGLNAHLPADPDVEALQHEDVAAMLPRPSAESDKYRRGVVGVVAGSARYPGAAVLAVSGALRGGAGAVRYVGPAADTVIARFPETLVHSGPPAKAGRVQSWVVGPGLGDGAAARHSLEDVLASDVPVLVDADGLHLLPADGDLRKREAATILTPHAGEAAALLGVSRADVEAGRLAAVRALSERYGATVLLKGSTTLIAAEHQPVRVNPTGVGWLATAGSGDVLSGLIGSLLATGLPARDAASVGAYLHGLAARRTTAPHGAPIAAYDVATALTDTWRDVLA